MIVLLLYSNSSTGGSHGSLVVVVVVVAAIVVLVVEVVVVVWELVRGGGDVLIDDVPKYFKLITRWWRVEYQIDLPGLNLQNRMDYFKKCYRVDDGWSNDGRWSDLRELLHCRYAIKDNLKLAFRENLRHWVGGRIWALARSCVV